jgi:hypothetical protein
MPYSNLSSVLDAAALTPLMTQANNLQTATASHSVNLTSVEIAGMYKMNEKRQALGTRGIQIAETNASLVPSFLNVAEAKKDMERFINSFALESKLEQILMGIRHGRMASGSEVMLFIRGFYKALESASEQNVAGAKALYDELAVFYDLPSKPDAGEGNGEA